MHKLFKIATTFGFVLAFLYVYLLASFALQLPKTEHLSWVEKVDGIVVFTGGSNRIETALSFLKDGYNVPILISGVNPSVTEKKLLSTIKKEKHSLVTLDYQSLSTLDNARMTAFWAEVNDIDKIGLITSYYHMPRSLFNLKRAGVENTVYPIAVFPEKMPISFMVREFHKYLLTRLYII
ncbi:MAG: hypothetical protein CFH43_00285 [Proteobacteria bacterium]|nr:MAG: hypothetical protein CFH43_00285 [Pseudomonadota bacterium]